MQEQKFEKLNDELLEATESVNENLEIPRKTNNKQGLIDKILKISEEQNIPLEQSMTKLKRMAKKDLARLLAEMIEKLMKKEGIKDFHALHGYMNLRVEKMLKKRENF